MVTHLLYKTYLKQIPHCIYERKQHKTGQDLNYLINVTRISFYEKICTNTIHHIILDGLKRQRKNQTIKREGNVD